MIYSVLKKTIFILIPVLMSFNVVASPFIAISDTIDPEDMDESIPLPEFEKEPIFSIDPVFKIVEIMPAFNDCGNLKRGQERKKCTEEKLTKYFSSNLKYPKVAKNNGTEGTVFINLKIDRNGRVFDANIKRDIGDDCGKEALRVVNKMNDNQPMWSSGMQRGKKVLVEMNIPVRFKLTANKEDEKN